MVNLCNGNTLLTGAGDRGRRGSGGGVGPRNASAGPGAERTTGRDSQNQATRNGAVSSIPTCYDNMK